MAPINFKVDEQTLLKAYKIGSLRPSKWEEIDVDADTGAGPMGDDDPLGLETSAFKDQAWRQLDPETQATTSLSSLTFDPTAYLTLAHPRAAHHDLARGVAHLQRVLEARAGAVRVLVEENFDRFVIVKGATEGLFEEMKNDVLSAERDFAAKPLTDHLRGAARKGNQIFLPVLEAAATAEKLRTTLSVFERSKFFFNLPSFIMESIATGHYELALRDYKKGKYILENRPGQLLPIAGAAAASPTAHARAQQQQMRVLNRVWAGVERAMAELKRVLIAQLMDPGRAAEEQEKALETLLEIHGDDDPLWMYFDSHHTHIMDALTGAYRTAVKEIDYVLKTPGVAERAENTLKTELQTSVIQLYAKQADSLIAKSSAEPAWNAIFELVRSVSEVIASSLPSFWRVSKAFIEGRVKKPASGPGTKRSPTQCRTMAFDIVKLYISLISQLFVLSDMVLMAAAEKNSRSKFTPPPRLPVNSHALCTAHYLQRMFGEVQECVNELSALEISIDTRNGLASLVDSLRWRFLDVLAREWVRDANIFYHLETWIACWDAASSPTRYLAQFGMFQRCMMATAYKIASGGDSPPARPARQKGISPVLATKITKAAFDSTHAFLDGLILLASEDSPIVKSPVLVEGEGSMEMSLHELVDLKDANNRLLVVISNISRFSRVDLPEMITQLENVFGLAFTEEKHTLTAVLEELDDNLFERYTKPRVQVFKALLREAVLQGSIDWYNAPFPIAIRPQTYKILNYLVEVHAHLCTITPALLEKILSNLIGQLVSQISRAFRQVPRFGMGGLLTAIMDVTFLQKSLSSYGRDANIAKGFDYLINKQLRGLNESLTKSSRFETGHAAIQKVIASARSKTAVHFVCFRHASDNNGSGLKAQNNGIRDQMKAHGGGDEDEPLNLT